MNYTLNAQGEAVICHDLVKWGLWFATAKRTVGVTSVGRYTVSSVFMGIDFNVGADPSSPVLWETALFLDDNIIHVDRCSGNREQAEALHANAVTIVSNPEFKPDLRGSTWP